MPLTGGGAGGAGGTVFTDYQYYEDLAAGAAYTPPAQALATLFVENGEFDADLVNVEFWDGGGWNSAQSTTQYETRCSLNQDTDQHLRVINNKASALKITLTGVTWA